MKMKQVLGVIGMVAAIALGHTAMAQEKKVNIYNWADYIGETTLDDFTKATGIKTQYDLFTDLETLESKLLVGNSGYDVVVPSAEPTLRKLIQAKAVQKLDKSKIPNLKNLDPALMKLVETTDPGNEYGVIYEWGTIGIGYNVEKLKQILPNTPVDSWDVVFKPENAKKLAACGIVFLDSQTDILPTVLKSQGLDPNSDKSEDLKKAEEAMLAIRPYIKTFVPSVIDPLASGDACVAVGYSGDVFQAKARAEKAKAKHTIEYAIPKEGAQVWFDMAAIPAGANMETASAFINFVLEPKVMAGISDYVAYANAVPASWPLMNKEITGNPVIFPPPEVMAKFFTVKQLPQKAERERTRAWTKIKTGR
ncbi:MULTISPECIES: polyamine ABC transporter substrate-binding protein [unclassified Azospirillum]|uniref:polyamine ABC transporter substrate-binding protein n=1 Tax=unclassified Azospirillum TaxID=2630922 RepID=UPI000B63EF52|nr:MULTISPECIES: polyamine ABC transporter substrate-binding protein [unclassified Azospirillum]SNR96015.1 putrescine transport system substrate-binding protein [Azospirillum sp. RU38E]SNS12723.1 putrescine transport system substrate-binding protein [Azospirillum sp. RU37A]